MVNLESVYRNHVRAHFGCAGEIPEIQSGRQSFADQIVQAGLTDRVPHLLHGVLDEEKKSTTPFELFVVGEGKFGKSTLINALLGQAAAPMDRLPKTWCFNRYIAAEHPGTAVSLFIDPNLMRNQDCSKLRAFLTQGRKLGAYRGLEHYSVDGNTALQIINVEETRVHDSARTSIRYVSPVMEMEWEVPNWKAILPGLRLIDTQGINQLHSDAEHLHYLKWQYERADAVIWLIAADMIGSKASREELTEASRYAKHILVVVNKWDQVHDQQTARSLCEKHYRDLASAIIPFSALEAFLCREPGGYQPTERDRAVLKRRNVNSWRDLETTSGLRELMQHFSFLLDGKQHLTRNLSTYCALRQKQIEFRNIARLARREAESNIELYRELIRKAAAARDQSVARARQAFDKYKSDVQIALNAKIQQFQYEHRSETEVFLGLQSIQNMVTALIGQESSAATLSFQETLNWLATSSKMYNKAEFSATGRVAAVIHTACAASNEVRVTPRPVVWVMPDFEDFWTELLIGIGSLLSYLPLIGNFIRGATNNARAEIAKEMRKKLQQSILPQADRFVEDNRESLQGEIQRVGSRLTDDFSRQIDKLGGEKKLHEIIGKIDQTLAVLAVKPIFVNRPLKLMAALKWRN